MSIRPSLHHNIYFSLSFCLSVYFPMHAPLNWNEWCKTIQGDHGVLVCVREKSCTVTGPMFIFLLHKAWPTCSFPCSLLFCFWFCVDDQSPALYRSVCISFARSNNGHSVAFSWISFTISCVLLLWTMSAFFFCTPLPLFLIIIKKDECFIAVCVVIAILSLNTFGNMLWQPLMIFVRSLKLHCLSLLLKNVIVASLCLFSSQLLSFKNSMIWK